MQKSRTKRGRDSVGLYGAAYPEGGQHAKNSEENGRKL